MKRKQKIPRRTRRQNPEKIVNRTENYGNIQNVGEWELSNVQNPMDCSSTKNAIAFHETKEFKDKIDVDSKQCFLPQNSSLIDLGDKMNVGNWTAKPAKHFSGNFELEKNNLKRPLDSLVQSMDVPKKPTVFANFQNESVDGNLPVILNVFTLSEDSLSCIKQKPMREKFPVTPPCSPPPKPVQFTGNRNVSSCGKISTTFTSTCSTRPFLNESTMQPRMSNIYNPVRHNRGKLANGVLPVSPDATNQFIDQGNFTVEDQKTSYAVNYAEKVWKNDIIHSGKISVPKGRFMLQENIPSNCDTIPDGGSKNSTINDNHGCFSPRDIKVLELKKRLLEQEAALKKLRTKRY